MAKENWWTKWTCAWEKSVFQAFHLIKNNLYKYSWVEGGISKLTKKGKPKLLIEKAVFSFRWYCHQNRKWKQKVSLKISITMLCFNLFFYLLLIQVWGFVITILVFLISQISFWKIIRSVCIDKISEVGPAFVTVVLLMIYTPSPNTSLLELFWAKSYRTEYESYIVNPYLFAETESHD